MAKDTHADQDDPERLPALVQATPGLTGRTVPDIHVRMLNGVVTRLMSNTATQPGPLLHGDPAPTYVLNKGQWWIALQAEVAALNGEWHGPGREVKELNASETWREGKGVGVAFGREWLNGWSIGLGLGVNQQRSRFLRRETETPHSEVVVDTTWTGSPMGQVTNYTWDIVETVVTEPGVVRDYSATNTYTRLRIAPEVSYRMAQRKRFSLSARLAPMLMLGMGRKGNTVVTTVTADSMETAPTTSTIPLNNASFHDRFPLSMAVSAGLEVQYRMLDRWSVSALPTFTYWFPGSSTTGRSLSMNELGGAMRLRYDLRHKERREK